MSSTGRTGGLRHPDDFYTTPLWATLAILPKLGPLAGAYAIDPCAGKGAILDAVRQYAPTSTRLGLELDEERALAAKKEHQTHIRDALSPEPWWPGRRRKTVALFNPPFKSAMEFVLRSLVEMDPKRDTTAALLRLNWLASKERKAFHRKHPSDVYVLDRRPSFAISLKCSVKKEGCGWSQLFELGIELPVECPECGKDEALEKVTSDSNDYGWYVWGPGRGNRWYILDT